MRANWTQVKVPNRHSESLMRRRGERARPINLGSVVIDVGVKIADCRFGHH
jgi:hypothetical protein